MDVRKLYGMSDVGVMNLLFQTPKTSDPDIIGAIKLCQLFIKSHYIHVGEENKHNNPENWRAYSAVNASLLTFYLLRDTSRLEKMTAKEIVAQRKWLYWSPGFYFNKYLRDMRRALCKLLITKTQLREKYYAQRKNIRKMLYDVKNFESKFAFKPSAAGFDVLKNAAALISSLEISKTVFEEENLFGFFTLPPRFGWNNIDPKFLEQRRRELYEEHEMEMCAENDITHLGCTDNTNTPDKDRIGDTVLF